MNTSQPSNNNEKTRAEYITELMEKIEKAEKIIKISGAETLIPSSTPTQGTIEVNLPLSYRQLPRIQ